FVPIFISPYVFQKLWSNRRLALLPGFQRRTGLAILLMNLVGALTITMMNYPDVNADTFVLGFIVIGAYQGYLQLLSRSRFVVALILLLIVVLLQVLLKGFDGTSTANQVVITIGFILCIAGWLFADPSRRFSWAQWLSGAVWEYTAAMMDKNSAHLALLLGFPGGKASRALLSFVVVIGGPALSWFFVVIVIGGLFSFQATSDLTGMDWLSEPANIVVLFLGTSLLTSNWTLSYGELAARHRLLWLRQGGDREAHWRLLEKNVIANLMQFYLAATLVSLLAWLVGSTFASGVYLTAFVASTSFSAYFQLSARINGVSIIAGLIALFLAVTFVSAATFKNPVLIAGCEIGLFMMAVIFRIKAMRGFTGIDWNQVRPSLNHSNGLPNSIWVR
ncbi:MAG: hypothetical protein ABGY96_11620, partial [bacterium]